MGTGEWRPAASGIKRTQQADKQPHGAFGQRNDRFSIRLAKQLEIHAYLWMTMQLRGRSKRYSQATDELSRRTQGVPFNHIGWDGNRRSTNLIGHPEMATKRLFERQSVCCAGELLSAFPGLESLELFHASSIGGFMLFSRIQRMRSMVKSTRAIPDSPVPVVP